MHKLTDSDKNGNVLKGQAEIIYRQILRKQIKYEDICKSVNFHLIKDRINSFLEIEDLLLFSEVIINFDKNKLKDMDSLLKANIIFFKKIHNTYIHLCIFNKKGTTYPESFFTRKDNKYIVNQTRRLIINKNIEPLQAVNNGKRSKRKRYIS